MQREVPGAKLEGLALGVGNFFKLGVLIDRIGIEGRRLELKEKQLKVGLPWLLDWLWLVLVVSECGRLLGIVWLKVCL